MRLLGSKFTFDHMKDHDQCLKQEITSKKVFQFDQANISTMREHMKSLILMLISLYKKENLEESVSVDSDISICQDKIKNRSDTQINSVPDSFEKTSRLGSHDTIDNIKNPDTQPMKITKESFVNEKINNDDIQSNSPSGAFDNTSRSDSQDITNNNENLETQRFEIIGLSRVDNRKSSDDVQSNSPSAPGETNPSGVSSSSCSSSSSGSSESHHSSGNDTAICNAKLDEMEQEELESKLLNFLHICHIIFQLTIMILLKFRKYSC